MDSTTQQQRQGMTPPRPPKIDRFIDGAGAADGGTIACRVVLDDGSVLELGLDARMPKGKAQRRVFIGAGYSTIHGARILERGSLEEQNVIVAIRDYLDRTCGFIRREAVLGAEASTLDDRDCADMMDVVLMKQIAER